MRNNHTTGWHGGTVAASQLQVLWLDPEPGFLSVFGFLCMSMWFPLGPQVSFRLPNHVCGYIKLPLNVKKSVEQCIWVCMGP